MSVLAQGADQLLYGWGRTAPASSRVLGPAGLEQLQELVTSRPGRGVLARGAGCSYGDAAQNSGGWVLAPVAEVVIDIRPAAGTVYASASVTFAELLSAVVPYGLLLPVLPGTRHLTLGGAIAADVHGKNQRRDGSIASWVEEIELLDGQGELRFVSRSRDPEAFFATIGGMGLTGIILAATLRLRPVRSTLLDVTARRLPDLDAVLAALDEAASQYSVAWIDTTAGGPNLGRGIVERGDHLPAPEPMAEPDRLGYRPGRLLRAPQLPFCPVTPVSARAFNSLWYRKAPAFRAGLAGLPEFFHRLDAVSGWNHALGPGGIVQYQFAVPAGEYPVLGQALRTLRDYAPFLGTLKRFGPASGGPLSFPLPGWSLAVDLPAGDSRLRSVLDDLDGMVAAAGGRVYLAKDARLSRPAFERMYGDLTAWRAVRARLDPAGVFRSDLGRRLGLC
ncbi:MAG TPA: FAD-binding oxidoreductase [Streptosporangiaceae bacterium]|jgi:decaprenylphospho-beta-D-ribofuranose 2-oxidase